MSVVKAGEDLTANEREFILEALRSSDYRADGRTSRDTRPLRVTYARGEAQASAEVQLGKTRVLTVVTSELQPPYPDRPTEGFLTLNVEYSPMAALGIDNARSAPALVEVDRVIERCLRQSRALDVEALCVVAGHKVWSLRCDIRVLDDGGNVVDAAALATVAALLHFRLPEVSVVSAAASASQTTTTEGDGAGGGGGPGESKGGGGGGGGGDVVVVHHSFEKEPTALPIHHVPVCVSFGLFHEGTIAAVDPTQREELVMGGRLTYAINVHKELCSLQKLGGVPLAPQDMLRWCEVAMGKVSEWHALLQASLAEADQRAKDDRLRAIRGTAPPPPPPPTLVPVQGAAAAAAAGAGGGGGEGAGAAEGLAHLDFAELHVPIKVREESEKPPPPSAEEEKRRLQRLEKAAEDAERFRQEREREQQAAAKAAEEEERERRAAAAAAEAAAGEGEKEEGEEDGAMEVAAGEEEEDQGNGRRTRGARKGPAGKRAAAARSDSDDDDEEEEEGTTAVLVSEFAPSAASSASAPSPDGGAGGAKGRRAGAGALAARRAKLTLEGREEDEEEEDDDEGGDDDLRAAVKKPRLGGSGGGKKAGGGKASGGAGGGRRKAAGRT